MIDEKSILALQDKLDSEHRADKAAIRRVLQLLRTHKIGGGDGHRNGHAANGAASSAALRGSIAIPLVHSIDDADEGGVAPDVSQKLEERILSVIDRFETHFTFSDLLTAVQHELGSSVGRKTVSWVIYRNKDKRVQVVQPGRGQRKAIYAKMATNNDLSGAATE